MTAPGGQGGDLDLDPDAVREELDKFAREILQLSKRRERLNNEAFMVQTAARLGERISFSDELKAKMADRFGYTEGGLAQAVEIATDELRAAHDAMRQALATHLDADSDAAGALNHLNEESE